MEGLFLWATAGWLSFLFYAHYFWKYAVSRNPAQFNVDIVDARRAAWALVVLAAWIFFFGIISGAIFGSSQAPSPPGGDSIAIDFVDLFSGLIAGMCLLILVQNANKFLSAIWPDKKRLAFCASMLFGACMIPLFLAQMDIFFQKTMFLNNIFLIIFFAVAIVPIGFMFRRSGALTLFSLVMLLDVYLVWMSGVAAETPEKKNWYIAMIQSDLMNSWPVPLGFFDGKHMLGGGDMGFIAIGLVFAYRTFGRGAAVLFAIFSTTPLLLLPLVKEWLALPSMAWPYTIFIAPWAILLCLISWYLEQIRLTKPV